MARDQNTRAQVEAIIAAQAPREKRLKDADDILNNVGDVSTLVLEVEKLHRYYLQLAADLKDP